VKAFRLILPVLVVAIFLAGLFVPEHPDIPVQGAKKNDWNPKSFWYFPWGPSGVHKGIDIFAKEGAPVLSAVPGFVLFTGTLGLGGNVVGVLGPKWHIHYYAHLAEIRTTGWHFVSKGEMLGTVGTSGNAVGKPPHLHYAIVTPVPYPWRIDRSVQGWRKMFYLDPIDFLKGVNVG
jgi:murein DD-endopeptidase MepM/ murein hydrolase activator NlpD